MNEEFILIVENELNECNKLMQHFKEIILSEETDSVDFCDAVKALNKLETLVPGIEYTLRILKSKQDGTIRTYSEECY